MNKSFKTLENEEGFKRCGEIIEEAKSRTEELVSPSASLSLPHRLSLSLPPSHSFPHLLVLYIGDDIEAVDLSMI